MKYQATVEAAQLGAAMVLDGRRGEPGDYLVVGEGPGILFLKAATFEIMFRPVNGGAPAQAARGTGGPRPEGRATGEADEEPGQKRQGQMKALILKALGEGPKRAQDVGDWIRGHGMPGYTNARTSAVLCYLGKRSKVRVGKDHLWTVTG